MAESNEVFVDVKLDLKDVKTDNYLKNWVNWMKCYVRLEAIECFPCYLKISFYHEEDVNREYPFSVIRLNIPGVRVGSAASRTKSFTYGIFWKSNRKRCRLFMAFPDKQSSGIHMEWVKRSIDSLEQYRKDILENHKCRSFLPGVLIDNTPPDYDKSFLNSTKTSLNDTQSERDLNDILGPLPDIPVSLADGSQRWSTRRSSGCSGIYEEIMDSPAESTQKLQRDVDAPRGSIVSAIYVDMSTPIHQSNNQEIIEMPPPLPPRRRQYNANTPVSGRNDTNAKTSRRSWNIKNVFGRTKVTDAQTAKIQKSPFEFTKSRTTSGISKICATNENSNLLANCRSSFSTPDLTNIIDATSTKAPAATTTTTKCEIDEIDLDVMDIERSNSLNCSTNQFLCRPAPLNISANILWSHNLSMTMSSSCDSSAINLIGANVNNSDSFLARDNEHDNSGYCKMVPIKKTDASVKSPELCAEQKSPIISKHLNERNQMFNSSSVYCSMAPILPKVNTSKCDEMTKNITFERHFEFDEERSGFPDGLSKSNMMPYDETCSSGFSSEDGYAMSNGNALKSISFGDQSIEAIHRNDYDYDDDAISLTYTESPPQSAKSTQFNQKPFNFVTTKFDEKLPSYYPNVNTITIPYNDASDVTKYTVNSKCGKMPLNSISKPIHINNNTMKKSNYKTVMKPNQPTPNKIQKLKQRRNSMSESNNHMETHPLLASYANENYCIDKTVNDDRKYKTMPKKNSHENKKVLSHLDPNTKFESQRKMNFDKMDKINKVTSSPRKIYNKCATMANRLKTPPMTPTESMPMQNSFESTVNSNLRSTNSDISNGGLIRSWTRFRRIDFSPLKIKINNILQRTNSDF